MANRRANKLITPRVSTTPFHSAQELNIDHESVWHHRNVRDDHPSTFERKLLGTKVYEEEKERWWELEGFKEALGRRLPREGAGYCVAACSAFFLLGSI